MIQQQTLTDAMVVHEGVKQERDLVQELLDFRRRYPVQRLEVDGRSWEYWDLGKGRQTLVFLHGIAGAGDIWFQQLLKFSSSYRVIAPTYPAVRPLDELAAGVWKLLDRLGIERFQVVGSSLGGLLAQHMVAHRPERVERAVFGNTFPPGHPDILRGQWKLRLASILPGRSVLGFMKRILPMEQAVRDPGMRLTRFYLKEQYETNMTREQFLSRADCVFSDFEFSSPLIPHAIIESLDDNALARQIRADLKRLYPRSWVYTFKRGGHFPYLSRAEEYNRALTAFLDASLV